MKTAYLVDFNVCTRVVIDPDDPAFTKIKDPDKRQEAIELLIVNNAIAQVMPDIKSRLSEDHPLISEDLECPEEDAVELTSEMTSHVSDQRKLIRKALDDLEQECLFANGLDRISGGYATADFKDFDDDVVHASIMFGVQDENGDDSQTRDFTLDAKTMELVDDDE